jgi:acyl carrier protein
MTLNVSDRVIGELEFVASRITREKKIDALGLDSMDFLQLMLDLEKEFKIQIGAEEMAACETVGDLIVLVESKC